MMSIVHEEEAHDSEVSRGGAEQTTTFGMGYAQLGTGTVTRAVGTLPEYGAWLYGQCGGGRSTWCGGIGEGVLVSK